MDDDEFLESLSDEDAERWDRLYVRAAIAQWRRVADMALRELVGYGDERARAALIALHEGES